MTSNPPNPVHVIILAQGQQRRLPDLKVPKQMLTLPACAGATIIDRTLCQLALALDCEGSDTLNERLSVTVVCAHPLNYHIEASGKSGVYQTTRRVVDVAAIELGDPGNSSLKGIHRFLGAQGFVHRHQTFPSVMPRYVVLLGDVVYSWDCLRACVAPSSGGIRFVGSSDLSPSGGELWGLSWDASHHYVMMTMLESALDKHPKFEEYQPGQMRRWLFEIDRARAHPPADFAKRRASVTGWFRGIDDYTRDIDIPKHVEMLKHLSRSAADDDAANGLIWKENVHA